MSEPAGRPAADGGGWMKNDDLRCRGCRRVVVAHFDMDLSTFPDALGTLVLDSDTFGVISVREYSLQLMKRGGFVLLKIAA